MNTKMTLNDLYQTGIVAVIRANSATEAVSFSEACLKGGINGIEITFTTPGASRALETLTEKYGSQMILGAGSVLDEVTARIAILAGAKYIVSAAFDEATARLCNRYKIPYIPGCMTVKEMITALEFGASAIKLFPGSAFGPSYVKAVRGPLPQLDIMPTGGVSLSNVKDWFAAGCKVVGVGSELSKGTLEEITQKAAAFVKAAADAQKELNRR